MRKLFFSLLLLLPSLTAVAQTFRSLDFVVQPEYNYHAPEPISTENTGLLSARSQGKPVGGLRLGAYFSILPPQKRLAYRTGLLFNYFQANYNRPAGSVAQAISTLEWPVSLRVYAGDRRCASYVELGASLHYRLNNVVVPDQRLLISGQMGFGFVVPIAEHWSVTGQPNLRYMMSKDNNLKKFRGDWIGFGFELGVRRYF